MNDKFYNISKEKQDRIINAAIKVFALNGYSKAGTDAIVAEAGISKGLLFHYFGSKAELYCYLTQYCSRYMIMELAAVFSDDEKNVIGRIIQLERAKLTMLKNYPYLDLFLITNASETCEDVQGEAERWQKEVESAYLRLVDEKSDEAVLKDGVTIKQVRELAELCISGYKSRHYRSGETPELVLEGLLPQLELLKMCCGRA